MDVYYVLGCRKVKSYSFEDMLFCQDAATSRGRGGLWRLVVSAEFLAC